MTSGEVCLPHPQVPNQLNINFWWLDCQILKLSSALLFLTLKLINLIQPPSVVLLFLANPAAEFHHTTIIQHKYEEKQFMRW